MLWRLTEMAIPIAVALAIAALLYRYLSQELASPLGQDMCRTFE